MLSLRVWRGKKRSEVNAPFLCFTDIDFVDRLFIAVDERVELEKFET